ncbi:unnamed protein product [Rotaria sp. Silwood1]|nr:unnamed protein product [Rotaria sp. Silwood1]CAF0908040.1 unnamed protein product [Rotaria sp. Silwood1]CAF3372508.1 unnamed protein product [Rotaria sp. Silwood1]CAF3392038.1 unnamed protein product [Rotaria sp. Silwood1]CAF4519005.1 unnamed protein product [Rotaria sp. Silwood1]
MGDNKAEWLHNHMMLINKEYQQRWYDEKRLAREQARIQAQKELEAIRFEALVREEEWRQAVHYGNDLERMWERVTSASPRYITRFRLNNHHQVTSFQTDVLASTCSVCLEKFEIGQTYVCWPCEGQHMFHYACMLDVLRAKNTCPLCRHSVEAASLPDRDIVLRLMLQRLFSRVAI